MLVNKQYYSDRQHHTLRVHIINHMYTYTNETQCRLRALLRQLLLLRFSSQGRDYRK